VTQSPLAYRSRLLRIVLRVALLACFGVPSIGTAQQRLPLGAGAVVIVHGQVVDALTRRPLPRALVSIEGDAATGALTDGDGRFEIPAVPAGQQVFRVLKPGFLNAGAETGAVFGAGETHNVLVAADMPGLLLSLWPASAVQGHITLASGEAAEAIPVILLRRTVDNGRSLWSASGFTRTNSEGNYRFSGLGSGTYVVYTLPKMGAEVAGGMVDVNHGPLGTRGGYPSVYYPDARDISRAASIRLKVGEQAQANIDLPLLPFHVVVLKVSLPAVPTNARRNDDALNSLQNPNVTITDGEGHQLPYAGAFDVSTHTVQTNLPDGTYAVTFAAMSSVGSGLRESSTRLLSGSAELTLDAHANPEPPIVLDPLEPIPIHLRLPRSAQRQSSLGAGAAQGAAASSSAFSPVNAFLTPIDGLSQTLAFTTLSPNAADTLEVLPISAGAFWASATVGTNGLCIGSFVAGSTDLAREALKINPTIALGAMELSVRDDCATLNLALPGSFALLPGIEPAYTVYVVPDFDSTATMTPYTLRPSSGGVVVATNLTPGDYHVYTFATPVELEYRSRAAMATFSGQAITLAPSSSSNLMLEAPGQ